MTTKVCYEVRFYRRKPGTTGNSRESFERVYLGIVPSLETARELRAVRYSIPSYRATGYSIVKVEEDLSGSDRRTRDLKVEEVEGDTPES